MKGTKEEEHYSDFEIKPYWRGRIHRMAFYSTICIFFLFMIFLRLNKIYLTIYFLSQLLLYGVSSTYHMHPWTNRTAERLFQKLDHSSIFLLISGTQTCIVASISALYPDLFSDNESLSYATLLYISYAMAVLGILKVFFFHAPRAFNVMYYILHGISIPIFIPYKAVSDIAIAVLCATGGILYILGGIIYGVKRPNPWPLIFGYHEVFHALTVLANMSFMMTVVWADYKLHV
ncbi:hemolysin III [Nematocida ausubeli]|uniref:Hemolysin III n=1 Tax=Nematocida ausubeli (strain ATCC PRA-371 / ERTm2) TaxID=1913371 RepID=A0A086J0U0_NEMA1|nr:uncharacterized protein NESG_01742 [Nematocida ausubeli]KAI5132866.1 hemolysin III [Nematocida ausubeli]KAI5148269.1 hemolysin III [Nematocida ausubeli]KAI5162300.1 hemolysin III [Nematocida ausubeli]KFG25758.1 hypothetical protein NESG_01742 [Nematocida ausubeli]